MEITNFDQEIRQANEAFNKDDYFSAAFFYKNALKIAVKLGDSEKIKLCKQKMIDANKKSRSQMKTLSVEQKIPKEEIDKLINPILNIGNLASILKIIGAHPLFYPDFKGVKESAKNVPISFQIASLSVFSQEGHLVEGGENPNFQWLMTMYGIHQDIITHLYLLRIFKDLIEKKRLTKEVLIKYFQDTKNFSDNSMKIMEVGIERFFSKDYISALHVFIPQFESIFLFLSEKLGIDVIALNQKAEISTRTKTLSSYHLTSEDFKRVWGEDFCEQVNFILFEPLGYKLRHKVAHGEITTEECNFITNVLLLYLFLALCARIEIKNT